MALGRMPIQPGSRFGPYEIVALLGAGGMGEVYQARDDRLNRMVAVKILPGDIVANAERRRRFVQEAQLASSLQHPNIVTVFDIGSADGGEYLAMELVKGRTLEALLPQKGLRLQDALRYGIQIADALAAAHAAGIVHRDLKPGNIMITDEGRIKILDFGLATLTEGVPTASGETRAASVVETTAGTILGTMAYMSPEQAEGRTLDARSDLFSFGAILYEMLSGQRAFRANSAHGTLAAVINLEPPGLSTLGIDVPEPVERLVSRCLRKDVGRRAQHASDIKVALEELYEDSASGALRGAAPTAVPPRSSGGRTAIAIGGLVLAAAVALVAIQMWRSRATVKPSAAFFPVPLTALAGIEIFPTFSPDGSQIAFTWLPNGPPLADVYVQVIGKTGTPFRLTNDDGVHTFPSWSPDGKSIALWHSPVGSSPWVPSDARLVIVSPLGGAERTVLEWNGTVQRIDWSPDGQWLAVTPVGVRSSRDKGITLVSPTTGARIEWASIDASYAGSAEPVFSPDGRRIAFTRERGDLVTDVYLATVGQDGRPVGRPTLLSEAGKNARSPLWTADGEQLLLLDGNETSNGGVVRVRIDGGGPAERIVGLEHATSLALSADGTRLAISRGGTDTDIWRVDLRDSAKTERVVHSTLHEDGAEYSPDGNRIVFSSNRTGPREIWVSDTTGENALALTQFGGPIPGSAHWSLDGREIVFDGRPAGNSDIFVVPAAGGPVRQLTSDPSEDARPAWSHDGQWIYFSSDRSGRAEIWRMTPDGRDATQVTKEGGLLSVPSRNGEWLYYITGSAVPAPNIRRIRPDGSGDSVAVTDRVFAFTVTASGLWFLVDDNPGDLGVVLRVLRFADNAIRDVSRIDFLTSGLSVSPDDRYVLVSRPDLSGSDLLLVNNFR